MFKWIVVIVFLILLVVFGFQNLVKVPVRLIFNNSFKIGLTYIIGVSFMTGFLSSVILGAIMRNRNEKPGSGSFDSANLP